MTRFVQGMDRQQTTLLPECLDDFIDESNPVRAVDVFVEALDLRELGFEGVDAAETGRPAYHPAPMLELYIYGYLNRVQSSRRLERECQRNLEVMWLTGRLAPDHKTIADFRKDNGPAIKKVCGQFVGLCRQMGLLANASVAIDGSKFKAVDNRDKNFTEAKMQRRLEQIEESVARYLSQLDTGANVCHLVRNDQMMLGIDRRLHVVADDAAAATARRHRAAIGSESEICLSGEASIRFSSAFKRPISSSSRSGSMKIRMRCARVARRSSIRSAH